MDAAGVLPAANDGRAGLSEGERVLDTFLAPSKTFTDILRSASWWLPFVLLVVVTVATALVIDRRVGFERVADNQIHLSSKQADQFDTLPSDGKAAALHRGAMVGRYVSYSASLLILLVVAVFALVYWASFNFGLGARTTYGQMFAVWMYASLPKLFVGLLTIVTLLAGANTEGYNSQNPVGTNPAYYMPDAAPWLRAALSFIDVFSLWQLALLVIGTAIVAKVSRGKAATVVLGWWALGLMVSAGLAAAFS